MGVIEKALAFVKKHWNTDDEVFPDDLNRYEDGIDDLYGVTNKTDKNIGSLSGLLTTVKTSIVAAINEVVDAISNNTKQINVLSNERGYLTTVTLPEDTDMNNIPKLNGEYMLATKINAPLNLGYVVWYFVTVKVHNELYVVQEATTFTGTEVRKFTRNLNAGTWSVWVEEVSINDLSTFKVVPTFTGGASGYEGGEIHFIRPPNESQYFTSNVIVQDIVGKTMRFYATTSQGAKLAVIDFESLPVGSATIATTSKTDILFPFNSGFVAHDPIYSTNITKVNNLVILSLTYKKQDNSIMNQINDIGVLPVGFRPTKNLCFNGFASLENGVEVLTTGVVRVGPVNASIFGIHLSFYTE